MADVKDQIKNYIKQQKGRATIPEIQIASGLSFKDVHEAISKLCEEGKICLSDGLYYEIQPEKTIFQSMSEQQRRWQKLCSGFLSDYENEDDNEDDDDDNVDISDSYEKVYEEEIRRRRQTLEQKRLELIERMRKHNEPEADDEITEDAQDEEDNEQEENSGVSIKRQNDLKQNNDAPIETVSENADSVFALINVLSSVNPVQRLVDTLNAANPAQRLVNDLNAINPVSRLTGILSSIAAKKEYEQSELFDARRRLSIALHNIAVAQDDELRNKGRSYSEEYFEAFNNSISLRKVAEAKYEIKADKIYLAYGYEYKVYLIYVGNNTYLSDEGLLYNILSQRIGNIRATRKIERRIDQKLYFKYNDGILLMDTSIYNAMDDYFTMYYAMRSLIKTF